MTKNFFFKYFGVNTPFTYLRNNFSTKINSSGAVSISSQVDNTLVESLDLNKNGLQYHTSESIKNLAKNLEVEDFLNWFVGFSDAESTFFIKVQPSGKYGKKTNFVFKISLHIDDISTLQKIQLVLSQLAGKRVGNVTISKLSASLTISDLQVLKSLIIPLFNAYPLRSAKYFDFKDWEKAIEIKSQAQVVSKGTSLTGPSYLLSPNELKEIIKLKDCMNDNRVNIDLSLLPQGELNPHWVLGFSEGESSFTVQPNRQFSPRFAITQHKKSRIVLDLIIKFFNNLPFQVPQNIILSNNIIENAKAKLKIRTEQTELSTIYNTINKLTTSQLLISSQPLLIFQVLSFFESHSFVSRKGFDFYLWSILIRLKLAGYHNTEEGNILMMRIAENMNSARYSNFSEYKKHIRKQSMGKIQTTLPSIDEINSLILKYKPKEGCVAVSPFKVFK